MNLRLRNVGKKFGREWVFREINFEAHAPAQVAILGGNGSGKSTLLQVLSGYLTPSSGRVEWSPDGRLVAPDQVYRYISLCAPYQQLYDEFTLRENVEFYCRFKKLRGGDDPVAFAEKVGLPHGLDKPLRQFSSGMRQRVKLGLAILAETPLLLLDEPVSHLDRAAIAWYRDLLSTHSGRLVFIASNRNEDEIFLCRETIDMENYRKTI